MAPPFSRDPVLAWKCKQRDEWRCTACGRDGQVEADHTRPLWTGGPDSLDNMKTLCMRPGRASCHGSKSKVEKWIRDGRDRQMKSGQAGRAAAGLAGVVRGFPLWVRVGLALIISGFFLGPLWGGWAVAVLALVTLGPLALRYWAKKSPLLSVLVKPRGPGLDGIHNWDAAQEEAQTKPGTLPHAVTQGGYGAKRAIFWGRVRLAMASSAFLAGWQAPLILGLCWQALPLT